MVYLADYAVDSLREHFYNLVCAKLYSYHNTNSRKVGNLANSQDLPNSQESEPPEDSASEIAYEDESDRDDESSTSNYSASPIFRSGDNAPRTRSHKEMPPFSAPTAPMLPKKQQMGNAQATLAKNSLDDPITSRATITGKANLEFNRNSPQSEPPSTTLPKQNITAANQFMSSSNLRSQGNRPTKRSVGTDAPETSSKRGRIEDVPSPHPPSLVVVLKLTREKKQFNGRTTGTDCNTSNQEERSTGSKPLQDIQSSRTGEGNHSASEPHDLPHSNLEGNTQQVPNSSNCQTQASVQTRSPSIPWTEYDVQQIDPPISDKPLSQQNTDQHEMHAAPEIRPDIAVAAGQHQIDEPIEKTSRQDGTGLQHRDAAQDPVAKGIQPPTVAEAGASTASPETDPLSQIWLTLFVPGNEDLNKADGLVTLTEMTSNEDLFRMMSEDLKGDLAAGDVITRVRLERRDGHALEGTDHTSVIIKKDGHRYTWPILASRMAESGAGRGGLNGSVTVKKEGDGK